MFALKKTFVYLSHIYKQINQKIMRTNLNILQPRLSNRPLYGNGYIVLTQGVCLHSSGK